MSVSCAFFIRRICLCQSNIRMLFAILIIACKTLSRTYTVICVTQLLKIKIVFASAQHRDNPFSRPICVGAQQQAHTYYFRARFSNNFLHLWRHKRDSLELHISGVKKSQIQFMNIARYLRILNFTMELLDRAELHLVFHSDDGKHLINQITSPSI